MKPLFSARCFSSLNVRSTMPVRAPSAPAGQRVAPPRVAFESSRTPRAGTSSLQASSRPEDLYEHALELARLEEYENARVAFESLLSRQPQLCKAWVSYAQMEKQCHRSRDADRWERCRAVLQRGLTLNPTSSCLIQSWGLLELQRGNWLAAVRMLERCARLDVNCRPVLRWQVVQTARKTVGSRRGSGGSGCSAHTCATIEHAK